MVSFFIATCWATMSSTTIQQLREIGEAMGLRGAELQNFVKVQQDLEREERERQREDKEKEDGRKAKEDERLEKVRLFELERGKLELKRGEQASIEKEKERQLELDREERARQEKEKERQEKEKERQLELEREERARQDEQKERQLKFEEREKERRMDLEREEKARQFELVQIEKEFHIEQERAKLLAEKENEKHRQEMEKLNLQVRLRELEARVTEGRGKESNGNGGEVPVGKAEGKVPKMPYFDEERDFMDSYLGRFERFAETQKWKREQWAMYLSALLKGRALDVYSRLPPDQTDDYDRLKDALLKRYLLSADGFKKRFPSVKPELGETPSQFLTRLDNYLERRIELAKVTKSYEGLKTLIVQEQYLSTCPKEMAMYLKEGKPKTLTELGNEAKNYVCLLYTSPSPRD